MKALFTILASVLLVCAIHSTSIAQSVSVIEFFKKHFNETVQEVHNSDTADKKRAILNKSFKKMISVLDRTESIASLDKDENARLTSFNFDLIEKQNQLNSLYGYDKIPDEDLDGFSLLCQDMIEQTDLTISMGVGTALMVNMSLRRL